MLEHHLDIEYETPDKYGYIHENDLPDMEFLRKQVIGLAYAIHISGSATDIKSCLVDLCDELDVTIPTGKLAVEKRNLSNHLQWHLGYQRCMLDNMNNMNNKKK